MFKKIIAWVTISVLLISSFNGIQINVQANDETAYVVSKGRMVYASSFKDNNTPENAVDGSLSSRYESKWQEDPQWFYVDLGKVTQIDGIKIYWKGAYAKEYVIQFSDDEENWKDVFKNTSAKGGNEELDISGNARYVRIYMTKRALTAYGYSFNEFEVYGYDGLTKPPVNYGENIALNKDASASAIRITDSMYDEEGNLDDSTVRASNAVDGSLSSKFVSSYNDNQWLQVDLGKTYEIGRVIIQWTSDAGKIYDIKTSIDGENWTTQYRQLSGYASAVENVQLYAEARYVRVYGYTRVNTSNGFCIYELEIYEYKEGEEKVVNTIEKLPELQIVKSPEGEGSYVTTAMYLEKAKLPIYKTEDVDVPIATNDWWQSSIMQRFGNLACIMPLKAKYSTKGLNILTGTEGWLPTPGETSVNFSVKSETLVDLYFLPDAFNSTESYDRVSGYSDYTASIDLCDDTGLLMTTTYVKGCPYLFTEFGKTQKLYLTIPNLVKVFDDNGKTILNDGETLVTDHIGVMVTDNDNEEKTLTSTSYYCLNFPEGTTFKNVGGTIRISLAQTNGYMSVGTMLNEADLALYYQHGYAFVTDSKVTYEYNENAAEVSTKYTVTTKLMRNGFSNVTMQCLLPHQWKNSVDDNASIGTYTSMRGDMKCIVANSFETKDKFYGLLPTFALPDNKEFKSENLKIYLDNLDANTSNLNPSSDAYWEGKNVHPLAMGVLMADQIGNVKLRDTFLARLKKILVNWFNYDGEDDKSFFIYDEHWGTLYYKQSEFGANTSITDHHFTYGYFMFGASVLSNYDQDFYKKYKGMIDMLVRDYGNYADDDELFCQFRNYDPYEGHSWAGGYANNDSGNNQESASEALFSWVGMYLWGIVSGNDNYRDAGVYGFTTEMEAVKQYWFNYDGDNWVDDYPYQVVAQVYGGTNFFGTFFGGQPLYCYGIQWLPVSEYLTTYGMEQERCAEIYQGLWNDTETAIKKSQLSAANSGKTQEEIDAIPGNYKTPDNGWQHITWSYHSMTNPTAALEKFTNNWSSVQKSDQANTYWYINSMLQSGYKTSDIVATSDIAATVYYNKETGKYTAMAWNPTDSTKVVTLNDSNGKIGVANVAAHSLVKFQVPEEKNFVINQSQTVEFDVKGFYDENKETNVSGTVEYDDNVYVEISCPDKDAIIRYTTDESIPTNSSPIYSKPILVSSNTTITAFTERDGYINSPFKSINVVINGTSTTKEENLAAGKTAVASSEENNGSLISYLTDGNSKTRWSSKFTDDQWCYVDLGDVYPVNKVVINWQNSYGKVYEIQTSLNGENWTTVETVTNNSSGIKETEFEATYARYVKMNGIERKTVYGYSIWEMEVYCANEADTPEMIVEDLGNGTKKVTLTTTVRGALIKYTLDGTNPNWLSYTYTGPFIVNEGVEVRALTYREGMMTTTVRTENGIIALEQPIKKPTAEEMETATTVVPPTIEMTTEPQSSETTETETGSSVTDVEGPLEVIGLAIGISAGKITISWRERAEHILLGQKYNIYINGEKVKENCSVGTYSFENLASGKYQLKVTAVWNNKESKGVLAETEVKFTNYETSTTTNVSATKIKVKKTAIKKVKRSKNRKQVKISLKKVKGVTGYQIKISIRKSIKKAKIKTYKKYKITIKKLKQKKKYYIWARTYVKKNKKTYYSKWTKRKKIK